MKTKNLALMVLLMVGVVAFSYWLGYRHGSSRAVAITATDLPRFFVGTTRPYTRNSFSLLPATTATSGPARQREQR